MNILLTEPIDSRLGVTLTGLISGSDDTKAWEVLVGSILDLFDRFVVAGGLIYTPGADAERWSPAKIEWDGNQFVCTWTTFPSGAAGLAVVLRMLSLLRKDGERIVSVTLQGSPIAADHPAAIYRTDEIMRMLPVMRSRLPFPLEICPSGSWINIECDITPPFPPETPAALNEVIQCWVKVACAGGFQIDEWEASESRNGPYGVVIEGPTIADDFIEWHGLMSRVPMESLNCLVNIISDFSIRRFPIRSLYIG